MYDISFKLSKEIYPLECILKAAFVFLEKCYLHIDVEDDYWLINICMKEQNTCQITNDNIEQEFNNEIIAQYVRLRVYRETRNIREMLLARAISSSLIGDNEEQYYEEKEADSNNTEMENILKDWFDG